METTQNQKQLVLDYMKSYGSIEPMQALRDLGVYRLASRISDLRKDGHNIRKEMQSQVSRITGRTVSYAKYSLS